jgi:hypothetical protein
MDMGVRLALRITLCPETALRNPLHLFWRLADSANRRFQEKRPFAAHLVQRAGAISGTCFAPSPHSGEQDVNQNF